jgi:U6 snRNA-associated Sm-like protein LSm4
MLPGFLLKAAEGALVFVELKNGETFNGKLVKVDTWMNVFLADAIRTSREGDKFVLCPEISIRGNAIKFFRLPDEILAKALAEPASFGSGKGASSSSDSHSRGHSAGSGGHHPRGSGSTRSRGGYRGRGDHSHRGGAGKRSGDSPHHPTDAASDAAPLPRRGGNTSSGTSSSYRGAPRKPRGGGGGGGSGDRPHRGTTPKNS